MTDAVAEMRSDSHEAPGSVRRRFGQGVPELLNEAKLVICGGECLVTGLHYRALAGIQFQVPLGGHWDYRPGHNNDGRAYFNRVLKPDYDVHEWSRVEILADAATGTARMAVAQPPGSKAVEVLRLEDPVAGRVGPIAWQMHNATLLDEYKDVLIEIDPEIDELVSTR